MHTVRVVLTTACLVRVVLAVNNPITTKSAANARAPVSASKL